MEEAKIEPNEDGTFVFTLLSPPANPRQTHICCFQNSKLLLLIQMYTKMQYKRIPKDMQMYCKTHYKVRLRAVRLILPSFRGF